MMDEQKTLAELVNTVNQIHIELQQMNKTLSALVGQGRLSSSAPAGRPMTGRPSAGRPSTGRPSAGRAPGYAGRDAKQTGFKRSESRTEGAS